ncbi:MAG: hypothetical protein AAB875_07060, partial [Patescibacteria group bacterium]
AVFIGEGDQKGSGRIKLDTHTVQATLTELNSGTSLEKGLPAVQWKGTNVNNVANIKRGTFGAACFGGELATLLTLRQGFVTDVAEDSDVFLGAGVTLGTGDKTGGDLEINSAVGTSLSQEAGTVTINGSGGVAALAVRGGTCYYNTSGTLAGNPIVSGPGILDFSQDLRSKAVTNPIEVYGDAARIRDPHKVIAALVIDGNEIKGNLSQFEIGPNIRLTRGTPA